MKKILLLSFVFLSLLYSCQKNNSASGTSGPYEVTANIDGTTMAFNNFVAAVKVTSSGITALNIVGLGSTATGASMNISILNAPGGSPIVAGTYSDTTTAFTTLVLYSPDTATHYGGSNFLSQQAAIAGVIVNPTNITITSIDAASVKGTFSGDVFYGDTTLAGPKKTITSGAFYAKFQ